MDNRLPPGVSNPMLPLKREDCKHQYLQFASGDYYIWCRQCEARWVCTEIHADKASPELANRGIGSTLSGQLRTGEPTDP